MLQPNAKKLKNAKNQYAAYVWLLLPVIAVAVFCVYPAITAVARSFTDWTPNKSEWIWFENYKELFTDVLFRKAFGNMLILVLCSLITTNVMTLLLAELLFNLKLRKLEKVYRYLFLLPALVPGMVSVLLWKNVILSGSAEGLFNSVFSLFGAKPSGWYFDKGKVILSMALTNFPWVGGISFLIYLSGLQAIPESVYEAAELDGVSAFGRVFKIDLPLLVGQIKYFLIIGIINGVQVYDLQLILGLSPVDPASTVPGYILYHYTFASPRYGYAASIGVLLFVITLTLSTISNKISDKMRAENGI